MMKTLGIVAHSDHDWRQPAFEVEPRVQHQALGLVQLDRDHARYNRNATPDARSPPCDRFLRSPGDPGRPRRPSRSRRPAGRCPRR